MLRMLRRGGQEVSTMIYDSLTSLILLCDLVKDFLNPVNFSRQVKS